MEGHLGENLIVLGVLFVIAYALGRVGKLIGVPTIPIYMLVGLLASPHVDWFPLSFEAGYVELIAVFGLILLLFNLGLEFDQDEFFGNAGRLLISGGTYVALNMVAGFSFGMMVGWGTREALVIAGMTTTSSSAIVTKLLIELKRLANPETPMILGVTVVEDIFVAVYLAIVSVVLSGETDFWAVVLKLAIAFAFLAVMFSVARFGGRWVSKIVQTKDEELFTILIFGLAIMFGGIGEIIGVTDAIGAFLIGLAVGATRFRARIEAFTTPLRDVFGAFFFLNFGLALDPSTFGRVLLPVAVAVAMTLVLNAIAGQIVARINGFGTQAGINTAVILVSRGEFVLILATLAMMGDLNPLLTPFAGLYVLVMAIVGPALAVNSERIGLLLGVRKKVAEQPHALDLERERALALAEAAMEGEPIVDNEEGAFETEDAEPELDPEREREARLAEQARSQSDRLSDDDVRPRREIDPEY